MKPHVAMWSWVAAILLLAAAPPHAAPEHGMAAFAPDVVVSDGERTQLRSGKPIVRLTVSRDGYVEVNGVVRADITADRFLRWVTNVEAMQRGKYIPEIGRFSAVPTAADLVGLGIEDGDIRDLGRCREGDCGVKLNAEEIRAMSSMREAPALRAALRGVLLRRAVDYVRSGDASTLPYADDDPAVPVAAAFDGVLERLQFFPRTFPCYVDYLRGVRSGRAPIEQSFLYWSKETLGLKPIISITHLSAARFAPPRLPAAVVVAKQVYATHYKNASVTVMALVADADARYIVYTNRTHVDAFGGTFGGIVRRMVERRLKAEAPRVLQDLRRRLESSDPPAQTLLP